MSAKRYEAYCLVCLGGGKSLGDFPDKRAAEVAATSHMNLYSHNVTVFTTQKTSADAKLMALGVIQDDDRPTAEDQGFKVEFLH